MVEQPENLNTHHLRQFREEIFARMDALEQKFEQKMEKLDQKARSNETSEFDT